MEGLIEWLLNVIDMLLIGAKYLMWGIGVLGIPVSIILAFANIKNGFRSFVLMIAALCLSIAVVLALMPNALLGILTGVLLSNRIIIAGIFGIIAMVIAGLVFFSKKDFPKLNLLFNND